MRHEIEPPKTDIEEEEKVQNPDFYTSPKKRRLLNLISASIISLTPITSEIRRHAISNIPDAPEKKIVLETDSYPEASFEIFNKKTEIYGYNKPLNSKEVKELEEEISKSEFPEANFESQTFDELARIQREKYPGNTRHFEFILSNSCWQEMEESFDQAKQSGLVGEEIESPEEWMAYQFAYTQALLKKNIPEYPLNLHLKRIIVVKDGLIKTNEIIGESRFPWVNNEWKRTTNFGYEPLDIHARRHMTGGSPFKQNEKILERRMRNFKGQKILIDPYFVHEFVHLLGIGDLYHENVSVKNEHSPPNNVTVYTNDVMCWPGNMNFSAPSRKILKSEFERVENGDTPLFVTYTGYNHKGELTNEVWSQHGLFPKKIEVNIDHGAISTIKKLTADGETEVIYSKKEQDSGSRFSTKTSVTLDVKELELRSLEIKNIIDPFQSFQHLIVKTELKSGKEALSLIPKTAINVDVLDGNLELADINISFLEDRIPEDFEKVHVFALDRLDFKELDTDIYEYLENNTNIYSWFKAGGMFFFQATSMEDEQYPKKLQDIPLEIHLPLVLNSN